MSPGHHNLGTSSPRSAPTVRCGCSTFVPSNTRPSFTKRLLLPIHKTAPRPRQTPTTPRPPRRAANLSLLLYSDWRSPQHRRRTSRSVMPIRRMYRSWIRGARAYRRWKLEGTRRRSTEWLGEEVRWPTVERRVDQGGWLHAVSL